MKEVYYTYNNEAIASCVMLKLLQEVEAIDVARSCLILPFLLDDRTTMYLKSNIDKISNLEQFINTKAYLFASFNKRYLALLPVYINSVLLLHDSNQVDITPSIKLKSEILVDDADLGERFSNIKEALPVLIKLIEPYTTAQLYQLLKIQL